MRDALAATVRGSLIYDLMIELTRTFLATTEPSRLPASLVLPSMVVIILPLTLSTIPICEKVKTTMSPFCGVKNSEFFGKIRQLLFFAHTFKNLLTDASFGGFVIENDGELFSSFCTQKDTNAAHQG